MAAFYGFNVPKKENELLRKMSEDVYENEQADRSFSEHMETVKHLIDSMDMPGINTPYMERLVSAELADLQASLPLEDSTYRRQMYSNIIQTYLELKNAKSILVETKDASAQAADCNNIIDRYKDELEQAQRDLDICRQLSKR